MLWIVIGAGVGYAIGTQRGREGEGLLFGAFLGFIGWFIILVGPDYRRKCKECLGAVPKAATKCCHCASVLTTQTSETSPQTITVAAASFDQESKESVFNCPNCMQENRAPLKMRGLPVTCKSCEQWVTVPMLRT